MNIPFAAFMVNHPDHDHYHELTGKCLAPKCQKHNPKDENEQVENPPDGEHDTMDSRT